MCALISQGANPESRIILSAAQTWRGNVAGEAEKLAKIGLSAEAIQARLHLK
jgi:hypothetical protein